MLRQQPQSCKICWLERTTQCIFWSQVKCSHRIFPGCNPEMNLQFARQCTLELEEMGVWCGLRELLLG